MGVPTASIEGLLTLADNRVGRSMTEEECRFYLQMEACPRATVPNVVGSTEEAARSKLDAAGFRVDVAFRLPTSNPEKGGTVVVQDPVQGTSIVVRSTVALVLAQYSRR
jgi:beta-lactam-binding protein with PASTA domain